MANINQHQDNKQICMCIYLRYLRMFQHMCHNRHDLNIPSNYRRILNNLGYHDQNRYLLHSSHISFCLDPSMYQIHTLVYMIHLDPYYIQTRTNHTHGHFNIFHSFSCKVCTHLLLHLYNILPLSRRSLPLCNKTSIPI